jgi:N utilization substance protein A
VINFTHNIQLFIQRALSPAKISNIKLDEANKHAQVFLDPSEVSKAIGKGGVNIKLASQLTSYTLDVYRNTVEDEEDVSLDEFSDEIEAWVISAIKSIGCDTAKSVLELNKEELVRRTDLEEETIEEVLEILRSEFE